MERITSKVYGMAIHDCQRSLKSYEKFNHTSSLDYLKAAQQKFGEIPVIINRAPHTSNDTKICKRTRMSNWHICLDVPPPF